MKKAAKGIFYIAHPLRLHILEYLDVNGSSSVSAITKALGEDQVAVSQSLRKCAMLIWSKPNAEEFSFYYNIYEEYPASIFSCLLQTVRIYDRRFFSICATVQNHAAGRLYTMMAANRIKLFANYDKMRILEFLTLNGPCNVSEIINGIGLRTDQSFAISSKRLRDDGFANPHPAAAALLFTKSPPGVHKTCIQCIRKRYHALADKTLF